MNVGQSVSQFNTNNVNMAGGLVPTYQPLHTSFCYVDGNNTKQNTINYINLLIITDLTLLFLLPFQLLLLLAMSDSQGPP